MRRMSVGGSFTTQSPGLQAFISDTSRLLIVTAATSDSAAGLLKIPNWVRVGVRRDVGKSRIARSYCSRVACVVMMPNNATSRRARVFRNLIHGVPALSAVGCAGLGVLVDRGRVEVDGADEDGRAVEHERLAVQAGARRPDGRFRRPWLGGACRFGPQLVQAHASLEEGAAVLHVAGMHQPNV